jgi:hypothetical protein
MILTLISGKLYLEQLTLLAGEQYLETFFTLSGCLKKSKYPWTSYYLAITAHLVEHHQSFNRFRSKNLHGSFLKYLLSNSQ